MNPGRSTTTSRFERGLLPAHDDHYSACAEQGDPRSPHEPEAHAEQLFHRQERGDGEHPHEIQPVAPPPTVLSYMMQQAIQPVLVNGEVMVGAVLPPAVPIYPIPLSPYVYSYVNGQGFWSSRPRDRSSTSRGRGVRPQGRIYFGCLSDGAAV